VAVEALKDFMLLVALACPDDVSVSAVEAALEVDANEGRVLLRLVWRGLVWEGSVVYKTLSEIMGLKFTLKHCPVILF